MINNDKVDSIMPIQQPNTNKQGFPLRLFAVAFAISLVIAVFSGWQSWQMHERAEEISRKHFDIEMDIGRIKLFDEVLTMSARMAAASGDFSYEKRYDEFDPQLTAILKKLQAELPQPDISTFIKETDIANLALVKMERQAFAWTHQGRGSEASALLTSAEYLRLKKVYADGMDKTINAAKMMIENEIQEHHNLSVWLATINALGVLVLVAAWLFSIHAAHQWAAERTLAEEALHHAQDELVQREKLAVLGQIAGSVGHELRNPLGVMSNAVYFLQTVLSDEDETTQEYLNIIKDEITGSERIVSDLLDAVRIRPPHTESVDLAVLIEMTLLKCNLPSSVTMKLDIPAVLSPLQVDVRQIKQVLRNLICNGVEAMPEGCVLEISAVENKQDGTVSISVRDTGIGMTAEQLSHLFQPLFTTKARGIGLGLVVVKNLTEANGGTVNVESEAGKGTLFTVTFPAAD